MENKDIVTYNQAVELNDLGFDQECDFIYYFTYHNHENPVLELYETADHYEVEKEWYAPYQYQAQKWLREVHCLSVEVYSALDSDNQWEWRFTLQDLNDYMERPADNFIHLDGYSTYEEALSKGINQAIKLLKQRNKDEKVS